MAGLYIGQSHRFESVDQVVSVTGPLEDQEQEKRMQQAMHLASVHISPLSSAERTATPEAKHTFSP
ncbi:hypothetical protein DLE60_16465 [Micromonospora globispora]|uniref:Uncharacterized protein n=1 Tax=Micromonospora globispora TaxID=1450148 RepID=A0A317K351_9ACTN|nr:hypothetical protein [Micromonospora globispora]PWU47356.1 hypothetical protein DLJ46_15040 [Micromonospora globispora]PWU59429.1 hypothetical protein DLE60_16465 [Micromonospora globispora]RQX00733.1 hypothetical protein DKL51_06365 [Micromonospora globispora]